MKNMKLEIRAKLSQSLHTNELLCIKFMAYKPNQLAQATFNAMHCPNDLIFGTHVYLSMVINVPMACFEKC